MARMQFGGRPVEEDDEAGLLRLNNYKRNEPRKQMGTLHTTMSTTPVVRGPAGPAEPPPRPAAVLPIVEPVRITEGVEELVGDGCRGLISRLEQFSCRPDSLRGTIQNPQWICVPIHRFFKLCRSASRTISVEIPPPQSTDPTRPTKKNELTSNERIEEALT
ncbi:hypothetical protein PGT21_020278 [Puccinia graminis f. sp. tritici]|uniref:Uncharacterized protein n=2 Tax=Puccinia graminis f. sp. tritici TaxID=56615 RepID=E3KAS2_PUCGT|nr:uncharacterized protein PGTG_06812 [Puccinia graminis f. sp. tritici CRL 75-36-700-3]EFP81191.1 hypothetical protein PGTG_06812 [Puccinia graminis f. sp. tritici CRL 75-36-700-3]KAA1119277.1 hypothetical protein PGT21_020278 [Puccinia graminis f. sp. tritici]